MSLANERKMNRLKAMAIMVNEPKLKLFFLLMGADVDNVSVFIG